MDERDEAPTNGPEPTAEPVSPADPAPAAQAATGSDEAFSQQFNQVVNNIYGVEGRRIIAGFTNAKASRRIWATGRLQPDDISQATNGYVAPESYDTALQALKVHHLVALDGAVGVGKRAGAIHLLRSVTDGSLIVLSPQTTLDNLAEREFERNSGYLLIDRKAEGTPVDADFVWLSVKNQVIERGAYLVITTTTGRPPDQIRHVGWRRPDIRAVLRTMLPDADEGLVELVVEGLPAECPMTDVATLAARIAEGKDVNTALAELDDSAATRVRDWFDKAESRADVVAVTALAFTEGVNNRTFELLRDRLAEVLLTHIPPPVKVAGRNKAREDNLPRGRSDALKGLIAAHRRMDGDIARTELVFQGGSDRRFVIAELWNRYEAKFWNAVRDWIDEIVLAQPSFEIAHGLAILAAIEFDEVHESFLKRWADGAIGANGQVMATSVLWYMCGEESTAPVALRLATMWATQGSPAQRWTAAMAFGGELGAVYPSDAINRLWNLITQSADGVSYACLALASCSPPWSPTVTSATAAESSGCSCNGCPRLWSSQSTPAIGPHRAGHLQRDIGP